MVDIKRDWDKIVKESNGSVVQIPEALLGKTKAWSEKRDDFNKLINEVAKKENDLKVTFTNLMYEIQSYYAENGRPEIWSMDLGFNTDALKEGVYILNISEPRKS